MTTALRSDRLQPASREKHHVSARLGVAALVLATAGALAAARRALLLVTVSGCSMEPTYRHGDRVLIRRGSVLPPAGAPVVCRVPAQAGPARAAGRPEFVLKRLAARPGDLVPDEVRAATGTRHGDHVPPGRVVLIGDNPRSYDSRSYGFASTDDVLGAVVTRLRRAAPPQ